MKSLIEQLDKVCLLTIAAYLNNKELGRLRLCSQRLDHHLSDELYRRIRQHLTIVNFRILQHDVEICTADELLWHLKKITQLLHNSYFICSNSQYSNDEDLNIAPEPNVTVADCAAFLNQENQALLKTLPVHKIYVNTEMLALGLPVLLISCTDGSLWGLESLRYNVTGLNPCSNRITKIPFLCLAVKKIKIANHGSYILTTDGRLFVCGSNSRGTLGIPGLEKAEVFTEVKLHPLGSISDFDALIATRKPQQFVIQCWHFITYNSSYIGIIEKKFKALSKIRELIKNDFNSITLIIDAITSCLENPKFDLKLAEQLINDFELNKIFPKKSSGFFSFFQDTKYDLTLVKAYLAIAQDNRYEKRLHYIQYQHMSLTKDSIVAYENISAMPLCRLITPEMKHRAEQILALIHGEKSCTVTSI